MAYAAGWLYFLNWAMTSIVEFWFALVTILALVAFLIIGIVFFLTGTATDAGRTGLSVLTDNGGLSPSGGIAALRAVSGVIFAYAGIELIRTAAGETENSEKIMPKAINTVVLRIAVFYVASVPRGAMVGLPTAYPSTGRSPQIQLNAASTRRGARRQSPTVQPRH